MTRKHYVQIVPQAVKRDAELITVLAGDKGSDDQNPRQLARKYDVRPLTVHRESTPLHEARNDDWTAVSTIDGM